MSIGHCSYCGKSSDFLDESGLCPECSERYGTKPEQPQEETNGVKICPNCMLTLPPDAKVCDCGYVFGSKSGLSQKEYGRRKSLLASIGGLSTACGVMILGLIVSPAPQTIFVFAPLAILFGLTSGILSVRYRKKYGKK